MKFLKFIAGKADYADLTIREYQEYLNSKEGEYDWQLWNIEHLGKDGEPTIKPYQHIPDHALNVKTFKVKLNHCEIADG